MLKCKQCGADLGFKNVYRVFDLGLERVGVFCQEHAEETERGLKEKRFVEEYNGSKIYSRDGKYFPYWDCQYFFDNIEDTRKRIDSPHIAIVDKQAVKLFLGE
ncbi:hypothetical protein IEN91_05020 [Bacillus velezensis]|uniref:hypothetical protein n=1 Tax=Bacillus velezensis TaxID=492670 RepID=UPI0018C56B84|nr:hypothetical protein [Bacillus velezensis]QPK89803.1 hypothetical protein IEN91_05020 [Bacillus velezensis]